MAEQIQMLPNEGKVGSYKDLIRTVGARGDNLTPHHIPSDAYMQAQTIEDYTRDDGISIMMEHPHPGSRGRHRRTLSYGDAPNLSFPPRQALALEIWDVRSIYQQDGLYSPEIRRSLQKVIRQNKERWSIFSKPPRS